VLEESLWAVLPGGELVCTKDEHGGADGAENGLLGSTSEAVLDEDGGVTLDFHHSA
jgi:hypothetical protein